MKYFNVNKNSVISRIINNYLLNHKITIFIALLMMIVSAGATGLHAWLVRPALDEVLIKGNKEMLLLIPIAIILVIVALVVTFKPQQPLPPKAVPKVESSESVVDNGGSQGDSGTASSDIDDSSLDIDTTQSEVATDESGGSAEDSALVE